ncbi:putative RNA-directed DNA polymerase [Arabidopsis thaliana]
MRWISFQRLVCWELSLRVFPWNKIISSDCQRHHCSRYPQRYRRLVGRLIYLAVTRPDLAFSVHILARFMQEPREDHWQTALRVVRYLKADPGQGVFLRRSGAFQITGWCDSDWAGDPMSRRSVTGYFVQFGDSPISWKTKKQDTVTAACTWGSSRPTDDNVLRQ